MLPNKIYYKIKKNSVDEPFSLSIDIREIEQSGLRSFLYSNGNIEKNEEFEILDRKFQTTKTFKPYQKSDQQNNGYQKYKGKTFQKHEPMTERQFRVNLHSVPFFREKPTVYPKYIDLFAVTKGKAMMTAMNRVGLTTFPDGWRGMEAIEGERVTDFGQYAIDKQPAASYS